MAANPNIKGAREVDPEEILWRKDPRAALLEPGTVAWIFSVTIWADVNIKDPRRRTSILEVAWALVLHTEKEQALEDGRQIMSATHAQLAKETGLDSETVSAALRTMTGGYKPAGELRPDGPAPVLERLSKGARGHASAYAPITPKKIGNTPKKSFIAPKKDPITPKSENENYTGLSAIT